jgi:hypothetical protein
VPGMPPLAALLERFRRLGGPPGAPAVGLGVPGRPGEAVVAELAPVFAAIDRIEAECDRLDSHATAEAARLVAEAEAEAERIRADGRTRAEAERRRIAARRADELAAQLEGIARDGAAEAARVAALAQERADALARTLVARLQASA